MIGGTINVNCCGGTLLHSLALVTIASASIAPNPNCELTLIPAPFVIHSLALSPFISTSELDVYTIRYCTSRQVRDGLKGNFQSILMSVHYAPSIKCSCIHKSDYLEREAHFACNAKAMTPLSKGVAALVPVNDSVHSLLRVVVGYSKENK